MSTQDSWVSCHTEIMLQWFAEKNLVTGKAVFGFECPLLIKITSFTYKSGPPCVSYVHLMGFINERFCHTTTPQHHTPETKTEWHGQRTRACMAVRECNCARHWLMTCCVKVEMLFTFLYWMCRKMHMCFKLVLNFFEWVYRISFLIQV